MCAAAAAARQLSPPALVGEVKAKSAAVSCSQLVKVRPAGSDAGAPGPPPANHCATKSTCPLPRGLWCWARQIGFYPMLGPAFKPPMVANAGIAWRTWNVVAMPQSGATVGAAVPPSCQLELTCQRHATRHLAAGASWPASLDGRRKQRGQVSGHAKGSNSSSGGPDRAPPVSQPRPITTVFLIAHHGARRGPAGQGEVSSAPRAGYCRPICTAHNVLINTISNAG